MFVILMSVLTTVFGLAMYYGGSGYVDLADKLSRQNNFMMAPMLAQDIQDYVTEKGTVPADCATLMATNGFASVRSYDGTLCSDPNGANMKLNGWSGYVASGVNISDSVWQFKRGVVYALPFSKIPVAWNGVSISDTELNTNTSGAPLFEKYFLSSATNTCGSGNFFSSTDWCGLKGVLSFKIETRQNYPRLIAQQRVMQNRTIQKMVDYFNKHGSFPPPAPTVTSASLASIAGVAATASNCQGTFNMSGIPLDCADVFSIFGSSVNYTVITGKHIQISSVSDINASSGSPIIISTDISMD